MQIVTHNSELRSIINRWRRQGDRIAFVPTMGNLHQGHLALVERARTEADRVVASIFVNPLQFGPDEDFGAYPRTFEADRLALEEADADLLYAPGNSEIYPHGEGVVTQVIVPEISDILCGSIRPGHFVGVTTVVAKLFHLVQPDLAVFGKKDYQQLIVIRRMVADLNEPVEIIGVDTFRESDGLAMSSRNSYLSREERSLAPVLFRSLQQLAERVQAGSRDYGQLESAALDQITGAGLRPDYVSIRRARDLAAPHDQDRQLVALAAVWLGATRLIDNIEISYS
ncbi:MAG: pantoate--beta-alanine ligase [Gammaproteobacteria bacterium]